MNLGISTTSLEDKTVKAINFKYFLYNDGVLRTNLFYLRCKTDIVCKHTYLLSVENYENNNS